MKRDIELKKERERQQLEELARQAEDRCALAPWHAQWVSRASMFFVFFFASLLLFVVKHLFRPVLCAWLPLFVACVPLCAVCQEKDGVQEAAPGSRSYAR